MNDPEYYRKQRQKLEERFCIVMDATRDERVYACGLDFMSFFSYYFLSYLSYPYADFHFDFFRDCREMLSGKLREAAWIGFRECSKTSIAKGFLTWLIIYGKRKYINVDSLDANNSERILFDIIVELQTNPAILKDFGRLYTQKRDPNSVTQKQISNFIVGGTRVEAHSTNESVRGRIHGSQRPDFLLCHEKGTPILYDGRWINVEEHPSFSGTMRSRGKILSLHGLPFPEVVTEEHRYWTRYIPLKTVKKTTTRKQKLLYEGWTEARDLTKHHYVGYKIDGSVSYSFPDLEKYRPGAIIQRDNHGRIVRSGGNMEKSVAPEFTDPDWWWFFGLWWGDGNLGSTYCRGKKYPDNRIVVTIANKDAAILDKVRTLLGKYSTPYSISPKIGCFQLVFSHVVLGRWLRTWYRGKSRKIPPAWVENLPFPYQEQLIRGYIAADGFVDIPKNEVRLTSVFLNGLLSVRRILMRLGIPSSIRNGIDGKDEYHIQGRRCRTQKKYDLRFRDGASKIGFPIRDQKRYTFPESFIDSGYLWVKVRSIEDSGPFDACPIRTEDHTYTSHFGISHNCDDFESNKTKDSAPLTAQVIKHIDEFKGGLDAKANVLYLGNYITQYGSVQSLIDRSKTDDRLRVRLIPILNEHGNPTWPQKYALTDEEAARYDKVSIQDKRKQLGSRVFTVEMMNDPSDPESREFPETFFQYVPLDQILRIPSERIATIDTAVSKGKEDDATGVTRNYVVDGIWHLRSKPYRINSKGVIDLIFQLHEEGFTRIGIEEISFVEAIKPFFVDECRRRNVFPRLVMLKHRGKRKEERIRGLIPLYEAKMIYHVRGECDQLEEEAIRFPNGKHDDCLDSAAYMLQLVRNNHDKGKNPLTYGFKPPNIGTSQELSDLFEPKPERTDIIWRI